MKWNKVSEKLPLKDGFYIVHVQSNVMNKKGLVMTAYYYNNKFLKPENFKEWLGLKQEDFKHWLKLPKIPKN